jgi:glycine/sarcosine N-methyltransferase
MGNSLAHLLSVEELRLTLESFESILNPDGILFIQNLNYDRILADKERLQSIKEVNEKTFVRFYDYAGTLLTFNVLTIAREGGKARQNLESVQLRPVRSAELSAMLSELQFEGITLFGSIAMDEYSPAKSKDLVVLARKKA